MNVVWEPLLPDGVQTNRDAWATSDGLVVAFSAHSERGMESVRRALERVFTESKRQDKPVFGLALRQGGAEPSQALRDKAKELVCFSLRWATDASAAA